MIVRFSDGGVADVDVAPGRSIAESAVSHAHVAIGPCRGHGRCGMCAVVVGDGAKTLSPPGDAESRVMRLLLAAPDHRLACQARMPEVND
jgi:adenylate cyclase